MRFLILSLTLLTTVALCAQQQNPATLPAGVINGDTIWLQDYSREVGRRAELNSQVQTITQEDVIEQTWQDIVSMTLLRQEALKRGIVVSKADVDSVLLTATPDYIKQSAVDERGKFDPRLLRAMALNPDSLVEARGKHLSTMEKEKVREEFRTSMDELRRRIAHVTMVERLKSTVTSSFKVDSAKLKERFIELATTATVELIYFPCPAMTESPTDKQIEQYYAAHADRYRTDHALRRLAVLEWPLIASPSDSAIILGNIKPFVEAWNKLNSVKARDSMWRAVSSMVPTGTSSLHPDSASHKYFYDACVGKKRGQAVGPLIHPTGVHVVIIDSIIPLKGRKQSMMNIRVIITEITPEKRTIDSILNEVKTAIEMYDNGTILGDLATKFNKRIEITPFFGDRDAVYGSYRLAQTAFETQLNAACPAVIVAQKGMVVGVVIDSVPPGPLPIEAAVDQIVQEMRVELSCASIERNVKGFAGIVLVMENNKMLVPEPPKDGTIMRDITVTMDGLIGESIIDPAAGRAICSVDRTGLMSEFRGDAGWYVVNVQAVNRPNPEDFPLFLMANGDQLVAEQRNEKWDAWEKENRRNAKIIDERWKYFRY